jgi:hypothetical protein
MDFVLYLSFAALVAIMVLAVWIGRKTFRLQAPRIDGDPTLMELVVELRRSNDLMQNVVERLEARVDALEAKADFETAKAETVTEKE